MFKVSFDTNYFAERVKVRREALGLSLRELAVLLEVSPSTLSRIERGKKPDIDTFGQICEWLEYNPYNFFYVDPERMT